jgi:hypothetical protein
MKTALSDLSHDSTESDRYDYLLALLIFDTHSGCRQWYGCCLATSHLNTEFPEPRIKHKIFMVCVLKKGGGEKDMIVRNQSEICRWLYVIKELNEYGK